MKGHGVLGKEESECLAKNCPGYVCVCTRVLTVAFRTRDNWKNMTDAEPHAFGDMWLQFWDCLSFLISGKQEDQKEKKKKKKEEKKKKKQHQRRSIEGTKDADITVKFLWGQEPYLTEIIFGVLPPTPRHSLFLRCGFTQSPLPVQTQGPPQFEFSHARRENLALSQRFAGRELEGQRDGETEAALQANWRHSGKLPEIPVCTTKKAWSICGGPMTSRRKAQRPQTSN